MFVNCSKTTPEQYFGIAVLNTNLITGFAGSGMSRQLESPSVKTGENNQTVAMKRNEVMKDKINSISENFEKVKDLKETEDTKEMIGASLALYEFVLPVYKTDYSELAKLYDDGASKEVTESKTKEIYDKYFSRYNELYDNLIRIGKVYAEKNNIKVHWGN